MQALYWHPVCESVLTLSLITPGWELDPSQHAGGWPLLSLQEAGPLSACCLVATGQHQCHHFIITQADSWTSLSKQEALSQSALHLHFNPTARLKEGPLSPDLWNGDICSPAQVKLLQAASSVGQACSHSAVGNSTRYKARLTRKIVQTKMVMCILYMGGCGI